jgi:hypothetical protein
MGGFMKPPTKKLRKPTKIVLGPPDAAIVFRYDGIEFIHPQPNCPVPSQLTETLEYLKYAIERPDWLEQWRDESTWEKAITDLATEECAPRFEVIEGGLAAKEVVGPFARSSADDGTDGK